jgi:hypothetical protein
MIDFALVTKIFHKNGEHKSQEKVPSFYGNSLFASDSMVALMSTGRKDDLESLIYILCYLYSAKIPTIEFVNQHINSFHMPSFLSEVLKFRVENKKECHERIIELLPENVRPAFQYIVQLKHDSKPDYGLIKLWLAYDRDDEQNAFESKLHIANDKIANNILFQHSKDPA